MSTGTLLSSLHKKLADVLKSAQQAVPWFSRRRHEAGYDDAFLRLRRRLPALRDEVQRNRKRVGSKLSGIVDAPEGRRETLLKNSSPATLVALALDLRQKSYSKRFEKLDGSLELAELATAAARAAAKHDYLSRESSADLIGETLLYLANARRLGSDLAGADKALVQASSVLRSGTGDRALRADLHSFTGSLRLNQRRLAKASKEFDSEIRLRKLLSEPSRLGAAFVNRGVVASQSGELSLACRCFERGLPLVEDVTVSLVALLPLAAGLARQGRANAARLAVDRAETISLLMGGDLLRARLAWVKGLTLILLERHGEANDLLSEAQELLSAEGRPLAAAFAGLDRAPALVALGKHDELLVTMSASYKVFAAEGLSERALAAFMVLHRAVQKGNASVQLATEVATFIDRSRYDRSIRFERKSQ